MFYKTFFKKKNFIFGRNRGDFFLHKIEVFFNKNHFFREKVVLLSKISNKWDLLD
jgi:hypothetical protein